MSDALIASLQNRVSTLEADKATLAAEAKDRRITNKKLKDQVASLTTERDSLTTDRDTWKGKAEAAPSELQSKLDTLQGQLRARDHRDAFAGVKEFTAKVRGTDGKETDTAFTLRDGVTVDALWKNLEYKAEGDVPDGPKISGLLSAAVATHGYLFQPKAADAATTGPRGSQQPITTPRRDAGPGAGKGVTDTTPASTSSAISASYGDRRPGRIA